MTSLSSNRSIEQTAAPELADASSNQRDAAVQTASPVQVHQWLRTGEAVLIDVREPDEHAREHIAGAHQFPLSTFDAVAAAAVARPGQRLVMHCRSGRRSSDACRLASGAATALPLFTMSGGIENWKKHDLPVVVNTRLSGISVLRQVQLVIGLGVLAASALAWLVDPAFVALTGFLGAGLAFAGATGTCALASLIGKLPWNQPGGSSPPRSCSTGGCS